MAIQDAFSLSRALNSQSYAYDCWYNYNHGNSMAIKSADMSQILQTWESERQNWENLATNDENAYEIEDDDIQSAQQSGRNEAQANTGFDGEADKTNGSKAINWTAGSVGAVGGVWSAIASIEQVANKSSKLAKGMGSLAEAIIAVAVGAILLANAIWLKAANPNKEGADACKTMTEKEFPEAQQDLVAAESETQEAINDVEAAAEEANEANEEANKGLEDNKTGFDGFDATYQELVTKLQSGQPLTEEEKALLTDAYDNMTVLLEENGVLVEDTTEIVSECHDEMGDAEGVIDENTVTIGEVQGKIEFAKQFDEATLKNAKQVKSSTVMGQVGSYGIAACGAKVIASPPSDVFSKIAKWALGIAAIATGTAAGILFGNVSKKQSEHMAAAETEIGKRNETQDINTEQQDLLDGNIDIYNGQMEFVENLEMEVPDDMEVPDEVPPEGGTEEGAGASTFGLPADDSGDNNNPFSSTANNTGSNSNPFATGNSGTTGTTGTGNNTNPNDKDDKEDENEPV